MVYHFPFSGGGGYHSLIHWFNVSFTVGSVSSVFCFVGREEPIYALCNQFHMRTKESGLVSYVGSL